MRRLIFVVGVVLVLLAGCQEEKIRGMLITANNIEDVAKAVTNSNLTVEEKGYFAKGVMAHAASGVFMGIGDTEEYNIVGKTVGSVIDEAREREQRFEIERALQRQAEEEALAKYEAAITEANSIISLSVIKKENKPGDFISKVILTVGLKNISEKPIRGVLGNIIFYDIFEREVEKVNYSYDASIIAPDETIIEGVKVYCEDYERFFELGLDNMTYRFIPEQIVFEDGSKIKINEDLIK